MARIGKRVSRARSVTAVPPDSDPAGAGRNQIAINGTASRRVIVWCVGVPAVLFIVSQVLTNFTSVLNGFVFESISWALLVAMVQFAIAVIAAFAYLYVLRDYDHDTQEDQELRTRHFAGHDEPATRAK